MNNNFFLSLLSLVLALSASPARAQTIKTGAPESAPAGVNLIGPLSNPAISPLGGQAALVPAIINLKTEPPAEVPQLETPAGASAAPIEEALPALEAAPADGKTALQALHESLAHAGPEDVSTREQQLKAAFDHQAPH